MAKGGRYITRAPFHDSHSIRETWRPSHLSLFTLFDPRAHLLPFLSVVLSPSFSFSLAPFSRSCSLRVGNIVRSDCAVQCVAFSSTPEPVQDPLGVVWLKREQEGRGRATDSRTDGMGEKRPSERASGAEKESVYRTLMCHLTEIPPMRRIDLQPDIRGQQKCAVWCTHALLCSPVCVWAVG